MLVYTPCTTVTYVSHSDFDSKLTLRDRLTHMYRWEHIDSHIGIEKDSVKT